MSKILLVEDSLEIQKIVKQSLSKYDLHVAPDLRTARSLMGASHFGLILLDIGLPDGDGMRFLTEMKNQEKIVNTTVIFLTSRRQTEDIVIGFDLGVDDYITKPFNPFELRARVNARMKKNEMRQAEENIFCVGDLKFNIAKYQVTQNLGLQDKVIDLTPLEFKILLFFAQNENHVMSRAQILDQIWGNSIHIHDRAVDTHISNIRKKMKSESHNIYSVYGAGYCFKNIICEKKAEGM